MATLYGVNRTKANSATSTGTLILEPGNGLSPVYCVSDTYEASAASINDIIEMGVKIPKNAVVIHAILHADALGSSVTLDVGDYEDDDRYLQAIACDSASVSYIEASQIDGRLYTADETTAGATTTDLQIIVTVEGAAATGTIKLVVLYAYV